MVKLHPLQQEWTETGKKKKGGGAAKSPFVQRIKKRASPELHQSNLTYPILLLINGDRASCSFIQECAPIGCKRRPAVLWCHVYETRSRAAGRREGSPKNKNSLPGAAESEDNVPEGMKKKVAGRNRWSETKNKNAYIRGSRPGTLKAF